MTMPQIPLVRIATKAGACGAPGCLVTIWPGSPIVKVPGRAWRHLDCSQPGRRSRADRAEERAAVARTRRR